MVDRIRWDTVSYLPFYYVFFQFLLLTIFNLQANILTTKDILSNLGQNKEGLGTLFAAGLVMSLAGLAAHQSTAHFRYHVWYSRQGGKNTLNSAVSQLEIMRYLS